MRVGRVLLWVCVAAIGALGLLGAAVFLFDLNADLEVMLTIFIVGGHAVLATPSALMLVRRRSRVVSCAALALLCVSTACWLVTNWDWTGSIDEDVFERIGFGSLWSAFYAMQIGLLALCRVESRVARAVRWVAWIGAGLALSVLLFGLASEWWLFDNDFIPRLAGSAVVVSLAATLTTPLLWRLQLRRSQDLGEHTIGDGVPVELLCPRCGSGASVRSNRPGKCSGCGLGVTVTLEEPRCACGYLLYGLLGDVCPECGRAVAERWGREVREVSA